MLGVNFVVFFLGVLRPHDASEFLHVTSVLTLFQRLKSPVSQNSRRPPNSAMSFFCCAHREPEVWWKVHKKGGDPVIIIPGTCEVIVT
jgi:hypothetical protein